MTDVIRQLFSNGMDVECAFSDSFLSFNFADVQLGCVKIWPAAQTATWGVQAAFDPHLGQLPGKSAVSFHETHAWWCLLAACFCNNNNNNNNNNNTHHSFRTILPCTHPYSRFCSKLLWSRPRAHRSWRRCASATDPQSHRQRPAHRWRHGVKWGIHAASNPPIGIQKKIWKSAPLLASVAGSWPPCLDDCREDQSSTRISCKLTVLRRKKHL